MKVNFLGVKGTWREVADAARTTAGIEPGEGEPKSSWKCKILLAEHSPIRKLVVRWKWLELKYWVSVHFVRHKIGIEHWIRSQRPDRSQDKANRDESPQGTFIEHECEANAQAIINISRKRLCRQASPETRAAWIAVLDKIARVEPELASVCVPECIYRGFCPEMKSCGYALTEEYQKLLIEYRTIK